MDIADSVDICNLIHSTTPLSSGSVQEFQSTDLQPVYRDQRPKRRQNRTCDPCRESKRACDVEVQFENSKDGCLDAERQSPLQYPESRRSVTARAPCNNCKKRRKRCTINWIIARRADGKAQMPPKRKKKNSIHNYQAEGNIPTATGPLDCEPLLSNVLEISDCSTDWNPSAPYTSNVDYGLQSFIDFTDYQNLNQVNKGSEEAREDGMVSQLDNEVDNVAENTTEIQFSETTLPFPYMHNEFAFTKPDHNHERHSYPTEKTHLSSPLLNHSITEGNQRVLIKRSLLKIYHDSMEGALSCWLTERNCPYILSSFDSRDAWSSNWSNRIISRVCLLDRTTTQVLPYHTRNDKEATRALNLAVAAFAAQWTQVDEESNACVQSHSIRTNTWNLRNEDSFDRSMQRSLWQQAFRALSDAANNMSFKVVFALIIFSLTQKPQDSSTKPSERSSMQEILRSDAAPMFLEMALRQLHTYRRTIGLVTRSKRSEGLGADVKDTFDLLFWLAVMFDTLSATMYQRPFVVKDDDSGVERRKSSDFDIEKTTYCDLDGWNGTEHSLNEYREAEVELWGNYFLQEHSRTGDVRKSSLRWPCSYEDAASALCDAAPVKVLLFRRVGQLQDLLCRPDFVSTARIENAIDAALDVYDHWNRTYGMFITDCIDSHEDLPARVQSWYILLSGHWHLAVFALADVIDDIDQEGFSDKRSQRLRQVSGFTTKLRSESAFIMSELGRCSSLGDYDSSFSQSSDFHFAVNKVALLTEPWTAVLVQSFGRAGEILAGQLMHDHYGDSKQQLLYCIDALWILGKKSDMAMQAGRVLMKSVT